MTTSGQIIFARGILGSYPGEQGEEIAGAGGEHPRIAQVDRPLGFGRVLVFDHLLDRAVTAGDDPAILERIVRPEPDHHRGRPILAMKPVEHLRHRLGLDQRRVAIEDQDVAIEIGQARFGLENGMSGAELAFLDHDLAAARLDQPRDPARGRFRRRQSCVPVRGPSSTPMRLSSMARPAIGVQHLVHVRFHPRALARGEDDGGEGLSF
jgi:hypothetical protein